jgi:uncharacterized repeat protein (TIGR01451 family)
MSRSTRPARLALTTSAVLVLTVLAAALPGRSAHAASATISFPDFSDVSRLTLNGSAAQAGSVLRLVPPAQSQRGSAYLTTPVPVTSFQSRFQIHLHSFYLSASDGMTFVLQGARPTALGNGGGDLGYRPIAPSVAVYLDFFSGCGQRIGVVTNGSSIDGCAGGTAAPFDLYDSPVTVWVTYDALSTTLQVYIAPSDMKPAMPVLTRTVNIRSIVGPAAYVGFTAATGLRYMAHDVLNWEYTYVAPPEMTLTAAIKPAPTVPANQPLTYTFVATNTGQGSLDGVTFRATLPARLNVAQPVTVPAAAQPCTLTLGGQQATCNLGSLAPGASVTITITATVLSAPLGTNLCATGQANAGEAGATVTRQAQACTRVGAPSMAPAPPADLVAGLTCAETVLGFDHTTTCTLMVTNTGGKAVTIPGGAILASWDQTAMTGLFNAALGAASAPAGYPACVRTTFDRIAYDCAAPAGGDTLGPGAVRTWTMDLRNACTGCGGGTLTLTGRADPGAVVAEPDETNNSKSVVLTFTS